MGLSDETKGFMKFIREKADEGREKRTAIARKFLSLVEGGMDIEVASAQTCEIMGCTRRVLRNALDRSHAMLPGAHVDITVRMNRICERAEKDAEAIANHADDLLDEIDAMEAEGEEWVKTEDEFGFIKDALTGKTKRIPLGEARRRILQWKADRLKTIADIMKAFKADVQVTNNYLSQMSQADLENIREQERQKLKGRRNESKTVSDTGTDSGDGGLSMGG